MAKAQSKNDKGNGGGTIMAEAPTYTPRKRIRHDAPAIGEVVFLKDVSIRARTYAGGTKYQEVIDKIKKLKVNQGITFEPVDGETLENLRIRISSLVSRHCSKSAPEGLRYRSAFTADDQVIVGCEKRPV